MEIPPVGSGRKGAVKWKALLANLGKGNSIFVEDGTYERRSSAREAANTTARRLKMRVACRYVEGGTQIWRVE